MDSNEIVEAFKKEASEWDEFIFHYICSENYFTNMKEMRCKIMEALKSLACSYKCLNRILEGEYSRECANVVFNLIDQIEKYVGEDFEEAYNFLIVD